VYSNFDFFAPLSQIVLSISLSERIYIFSLINPGVFDEDIELEIQECPGVFRDVFVSQSHSPECLLSTSILLVI